MSEPFFEGVFSVLPTPFMSNGPIDRNSLERVVELYIGAGVNGLTALGVTSEAAKLSDQERSLVLETVMEKVKGRVPVVVGTTAGGLMPCIEYSKNAKSAGASAVMVSPPKMQKLSSEAVLRHYQCLSDAVDIPIVVQDYPPVSGFAMEPELLVRIAREVPKARTIKLEDPPTPLKTARLLQEGKGIPIKIFGGLGGMYLLEELMAGATGAMTGFAYPEILVE
ncbi:MAG: dihydrodipicolinate synthase family protein, partial [Ignavibacteria bacterium]|nr:dihydrodipicolinate synthase family protein [Ignavibacteria bacterium]